VLESGAIWFTRLQRTKVDQVIASRGRELYVTKDGPSSDSHAAQAAPWVNFEPVAARVVAADLASS
jgi:hypothetical protein